VKKRGDFGIELPAEIDLFALRGRGQQLESVFEAVLQGECGGVEVELARFYLGEIEDVVEEMEQGFTRRFHQFKIFALFRIQRRIESQ
jgi:hypothetical protein